MTSNFQELRMIFFFRFLTKNKILNYLLFWFLTKNKILSVLYPGFFWVSQQFVQFSVSLRYHVAPREKFKKQKLPFLRLSCTLVARHLCFLFCYQVSCFHTCLHYVQYSPCSGVSWSGQEKTLEFYLLSTGLFFLDGKDKQIKQSNLPPVTISY